MVVIQGFLNGMIALMLAKFVLNDMPHMLSTETSLGRAAYELTTKGRVLTRFETRWWKEALTEPQRLVMLTLYIARRPVEPEFIASEIGVDVPQVETNLRQLVDWGYVELKLGGAGK